MQSLITVLVSQSTSFDFPKSMTSTNFQPLLPKTKLPFAGGKSPGEWLESDGPNLFQRIGSSIDCGPLVGEINSIPSPWSRPLQLLSAIKNVNFPTRDAQLSQYKGFLAAVALSEDLCIDIKAFKLRLSALASSDFACAISKLKPKARDSVFTGIVDPWDQLYVLTIDDHVAGITNPATLLSPSSEIHEKIATKIKWVENSQFVDPQNHLSDRQRNIFSSWLQNLADKLTSASDTQLANTLATVLKDFISQTTGNRQLVQVKITNKSLPFQCELNPPLLKELYPAAALASESNVRVQCSYVQNTNNQLPPLYLIDVDEMPSRIGKLPQEIFVVGTLSVANFSLDLAKSINPTAYYFDPSDFFLSELHYIDEPKALPGSWVDESIKSNNPNAPDISVILPINPVIRDYFSSDQLKEMTQITYQENLSRYRICLSIPLAGFNGETLKYTIWKEFDIKPNNMLEGAPPIIAVWPFLAINSNWREYYTTVQTTSQDALAFEIKKAPTSDSTKQTNSTNTYYKSESFPQFLLAESSRGDLGIIPLSQPILQTGSATSWIVGVDFGTSLTNFAIRKAGGSPEKLSFDTLLKSITSIESGLAANDLREYFIPDNSLFSKEINNEKIGGIGEVATIESPPFFTALTTRGWKFDTTRTPLVIIEGRIYYSETDIDISKDYIHTNIKWSNDGATLSEIFLEQLTKQICALACQQGVQKLIWKFSFPTAFNRSKLNAYRGAWESIIQKLNSLSPYLEHTIDLSRVQDTESVAFAKYCANKGLQLDNTTCVDIGGGTSDISIWQGRKLVHQCSVQYAGRDMFHHILMTPAKSNVSKLKSILGVQDDPFRNIANISRNFDATVDFYLRCNSGMQNFKDTYRRASNNSNVHNKYFRTLILFSIGGLYYYLGIILKALHSEGKLNSDLGINTQLILGGNGARFFKWINPQNDNFEESNAQAILNSVMSAASGFAENGSFFTKDPKSEACLGLVVDPATTRLAIDSSPNDDFPIAGLPCRFKFSSGDTISTQSFSADSRLAIYEQTISSYEITSFQALNEYIVAYNSAISASDGEEFYPLQEFNGNKINSLSGAFEQSLRQYTNDDCINRVSMAKPNPERGLSAQKFDIEPPFITSIKNFNRVLAEHWANHT